VRFVTGVRESTWQKDGQDIVTYFVTIDTKEVACYDAKAKELKLDAPLPEGWEVRQSAKGKDYLKPPGGGGRGGAAMPAAFRNTKEGQALEQASIHRSVALTQAVAMGANAPWVKVADDMYAWLRQSAGTENPPSPATPAASTGGAGSVSAPAPPVPTSAHADAVVTEAGALGEASPASGDHTHVFARIPNVTKFERCVCGATQKKEES